jgi:hypothetical protein
VSREKNMKLKRTALLTAVVAVAVAAATDDAAEAVALRQEKATDASVCDLGPNTNAVLARRVLVPGDAASKDQVDAYFRLAATFIRDNCGNGQLLILHGASGSQIDTASLPQVANSACAVASVVRKEVPYTYAGRSAAGFELRCTILKRDELTRTLADLERSDPMEALTARMSAAVETTQRDSRSNATSTQPQNKRDCGKVTLASLLKGGGCK